MTLIASSSCEPFATFGISSLRGMVVSGRVGFVSLRMPPAVCPSACLLCSGRSRHCFLAQVGSMHTSRNSKLSLVPRFRSIEQNQRDF